MGKCRRKIKGKKNEQNIRVRNRGKKKKKKGTHEHSSEKKILFWSLSHY